MVGIETCFVIGRQGSSGAAMVVVTTGDRTTTRRKRFVVRSLRTTDDRDPPQQTVPVREKKRRDVLTSGWRLHGFSLDCVSIVLFNRDVGFLKAPSCCFAFLMYDTKSERSMLMIMFHLVQL